MNIHVANLSPHIFGSDLRKLFSAFGLVTEAVVYRARESGRSRGMARISFEKESQAMQAVMAMNLFRLDGQIIYVDMIRYDISDCKS
jgi:RNA recognition motif-containing protein